MLSNSPQMTKSQITVVNAKSGAIERIIVLQYNAESLTRSLQIKELSDHPADALRLTGPPIESFKVEADIDAIDQIGDAKYGLKTQSTVQPHISALEMLVYPSTARLQHNQRLAHMGALEIVPMESPLTLFTWSKSRVFPVKITDFSVIEEEFNQDLSPIRAKVSIGMRVLSVDDLGFNHKGGSLYLIYQRQKEQWGRQFFTR